MIITQILIFIALVAISIQLTSLIRISTENNTSSKKIADNLVKVLNKIPEDSSGEIRDIGILVEAISGTTVRLIKEQKEENIESDLKNLDKLNNQRLADLRDNLSRVSVLFEKSETTEDREKYMKQSEEIQKHIFGIIK